MSAPSRLISFLPEKGMGGAWPDGAAVLEGFLGWVAGTGRTLYSAQEEAILELFAGRNVILQTPTGSGKSLVALALHFQGLAQGRRSVYTSPIKALVNEKWRDLCTEFGAERVGLSTGDASVNREGEIVCCTAEILANRALRGGAETPVEEVVMDEFHFYADKERGVAWQVPLLTLPRTRFLLMSATLGETGFFECELTRLNGRETVTVSSQERPVPLEFTYAETPLAHTLEELVGAGRAPVYVVHFTQLSAAETAQNLTSLALCSRAEKAALAEALEGFRFSSGYGAEMKRWLRQGIGLHHAGLLPKYRLLVERLAQKGLLKVICGTDTLGVGINVPIRTVLFTQLCKYGGEKTAILSAREFHQIAGRAGRKGFDEEGWVVAQAPAHAIENLQLEKKQAAGGKKFVRRQPPEKNYVGWDKATFLRLQTAAPERLSSHFQLTHGMVLQVLSRPGDGCRALQKLVREAHEPPARKRELFRRGWQLFRALVAQGIVGIEAQAETGAKVRVNVELQEDFSMHRALSLYLLETVAELPREAAGYGLVVLSLVEAIVEDPAFILRQQLDKVRTEALAEMKADGMEYEQRMAELEKLEYPKPHREFIYGTFNAFAERHPWVEQENIRPKSIAREMFEEFWSFGDYVKLYGLQRVEGLLLRHLNGVYKVLAQTVPDAAKDEVLRDAEVFLAETLRETDSSLLEEWERLQGRAPAEGSGGKPARPAAIARDVAGERREAVARARQGIFAFLRCWSLGDDEGALAKAGGEGWTVERLRAGREEYRREHERLRFDAEARNARHTVATWQEEEGSCRVEQMLVDAEGVNDWVAEFSWKAGDEPGLELRSLGPLG